MALTAVSAQIALPIPPVPWTLQVFAVLLCGAIAGPAVGAASQIVYILIGVAGLPVFAGFRGGMQTVFSPSFGYILAFPIAAMIAGLSDTKGNRFKRSPFFFIVALIPIYLFGILYMYIMAPLVMGKKIGLDFAVSVGFVPFIVPDIIKAILAWLLFRRIDISYRKGA